jgi:hypothetical protein
MKEDETARRGDGGAGGRGRAEGRGGGRTVRRTCGRYTVVSGLLAAGRRFDERERERERETQLDAAFARSVNDPAQRCVR